MPIQALNPHAYYHLGRKLLGSALAVMLLLGSQTFADIYSWKDAEGNTIYSDTKASADAKRATPSNNVNYYKPSKKIATTEDSVELSDTSNKNSLPELEMVAQELEKLTATDCSGDKAENCQQASEWMRDALERCGDDPRCQDSEFLDRKYRPRTAEELMNIARKAGARNNRQDKDIALFLKKKYSSYCENQSALLCKNKPGSTCEKSMQSYCEEKGDLKDLFAKYDTLTDLEKEQIIAQAKQMAKARGANQLSYAELIASMVDILMTQALLGL